MSGNPGRPLSGRRVVLFATALVGLYLASRLTNLSAFPIFCDEAIYLHWADVCLKHASSRFISLTDGKQPLFIWLVFLNMKANVFADPLVAGRVVAVVAGLFGMVGCGLLAGCLFRDVETGLWGALLYVVTPCFLIYDRLSLYESLAVCIVAWSLFLTVRLARTTRLDTALLLGLVMGAGVMTKSSCYFTLVFLPFGALLLPWRPFAPRQLLVWAGLATISAGLASLSFGFLLTAPGHHNIVAQNERFIVPISALLDAPFQRFTGNLGHLVPWLLAYLSAPVALLVVGGVVIGYKDRLPRLFLLVVFLAPFLYVALAGKLLYPRFLVFMTVPLITVAARMPALFRRRVRDWRGRAAVLLAFAALPLHFDLTLLLDPVNAPWVAEDRFQYFDGDRSGIGVVSLRADLREAAARQPIFVATEGRFGLFPASLDLYFGPESNVSIEGVHDLTLPGTMDRLAASAGDRPCFLVLATDTLQRRARDWPVARVREYPRARPGSFLSLYRLLEK